VRFSLDNASLPASTLIRSATEADRQAYADLTLETLGRYARGIFGLSDDATRSGAHQEFNPANSWVIEDGDGTTVGLIAVEGNPARGLYERLGFVVDRVETPRTLMRWDAGARSTGSEHRRSRHATSP
jgi:hypothetical protein